MLNCVQSVHGSPMVPHASSSVIPNWVQTPPLQQLVAHVDGPQPVGMVHCRFVHTSEVCVQSAHVRPLTPQAESPVPGVHLPFEQHPAAQFDGEHGAPLVEVVDVLAVDDAPVLVVAGDEPPVPVLVEWVPVLVVCAPVDVVLDLPLELVPDAPDPEPPVPGIISCAPWAHAAKAIADARKDVRERESRAARIVSDATRRPPPRQPVPRLERSRDAPTCGTSAGAEVSASRIREARIVLRPRPGAPPELSA
jgi:hypothetical protein